MELGSDEELPEGVGWVGKTAMAYAADESMFTRRPGEQDDIERARAAARYAFLFACMSLFLVPVIHRGSCSHKIILNLFVEMNFFKPK
jgi:hypothetical protein